MDDDKNSLYPFISEDDPTRSKILTAAVEEFANHGLAGARVDRIAKNANVNKAMLYYHFTSKEKLFHSVMDSIFSYIIPRIQKDISENASLEDVLTSIAETYAEIFLSCPIYIQLFLRTLANPNSDMVERSATIMASSQIPASLYRILKKNLDDGKIRVMDIRQALVSFIVLNIGYFLMSSMINRILRIEDNESFINQRKKEVVNIFLNGVLKK